MLTVILLLVLVTPSVCWGLLLRTRPVGAVVGALLLACAGVVTTVWLSWLPTRAEAELYVAYGPVAVLLAAAGVLVERRRLGPRPKGDPRNRSGGALVALCSYLVAFLVLVAPAYTLFVLHTEFLPRTEALPVPAGLSVTENRPWKSCLPDSCVRTMVLRGPAGTSGAEVERRLRAALAADGWQSFPDGSTGRRNGWLLDTRPLRVHWTAHPDSVEIELAGLASESVASPR